MLLRVRAAAIAVLLSSLLIISEVVLDAPRLITSLALGIEVFSVVSLIVVLVQEKSRSK